MFKIIKKSVSLALIPVELYFGYLVYKNLTTKQNSQVNSQIIKQEINVQTTDSQNQAMNDSTATTQSNSSEDAETDLPEGHPKINQNNPNVINLTAEATVNDLTIGKTTTSQTIAALGTPISIHQDTVYIYENINLYFQNNILNGFAFPSTNIGFPQDTSHSPFKTSSGLTLGTPLQKVFEKYGPKKLADTGKIFYRDRSNGYELNISYGDNKIIAVEVGRNEKTP